MNNTNSSPSIQEDAKGSAILLWVYILIGGLLLSFMFIAGLMHYFYQGFQASKEKERSFNDFSVAASASLINHLNNVEKAIYQNELRTGSAAWDLEFDKALVNELAAMQSEIERLNEVQRRYNEPAFQQVLSSLNRQYCQFKQATRGGSGQVESLMKELKPLQHTVMQFHLLHVQADDEVVSVIATGSLNMKRVILAVITASILLGIPIMSTILVKLKNLVFSKKEAMDHLVQAQRDLEKLAFYDSLTGLPNRRLFRDRLEIAILNAARTGKLHALMFLDLDYFKRVNDTLGHDGGDELLKCVGARITGHVRSVDSVARISGDEFMVLLTDIDTVSRAGMIAEKILAAIAKPILVANHELSISSSMGISIFPNDSMQIQELFKFSDLALYEAKKSGRNNYKYFSRSINQAVQQLDLRKQVLKEAVSQNRFVLHYQPQMDFTSMQPRTFEALVRLVDDDGGMVLPVDFISLAEDIGVMPKLSHIIFDALGHDVQQLQGAGFEELRFSFNLSSKQVKDPQTPQKFRDMIQRYGLSPERFIVEIAEPVAFENDEQTAEIMLAFKAQGLTIAMDRFGRGAFSLDLLNRLPLDILKLDNQLILDMEKDAKKMAMVKGIVAMAHQIGLKVVASGVETQSQFDKVKEMGCDLCQGFFLSQPASLSNGAHAAQSGLIPFHPQRQALKA